MANGTYSTTDCHIIEDPDPAYVQYSGRGDIEYPLMCDIETPDSLAGRNEEEAEDDPSYQIIRMGFSVSAWAGVSFPYEGDYIQRAKKLIRRAKLLLFWNKNYDLPRLKANGFELHPDVVVVDAMWAWHFLYSDLPKALAFAAPFFYNGYPWKHLFSQKPGFYNGMDNAVQMGVYQGVKRELEKQGRWQRFWDHCVRVDPIYVSMGKAGVKVDKVARFNFMSTLEDEAVKELGAIQSLLPNKCKSIEFLEREPKPVHRLKGDSDLKWRWRQLTKIEQMEVPAYHKDGSKVVTTSNEQMYRPLWKRTTPFNPASHDQVSNLLLALNIPLPKKRGEDRTTVEAKYLKRLADKHPILKHVVEYGKREQLVTTYDWPLDESDRAHTTYGNHPSTWRSSSRNVNLGNIPKRYDLAQLFRSLLIAERGCKLIEIDRSAIEAVLVGYWGKSPEYIKLAKAGVHSFLGSHILGSPVSWETVRDTPLPELRKLLKEFKKIGGIEQYESWKRCIHGSNYLLSAYGMHDEYEEFFPTTYAAQQMQDVYFNSPAGHSVRAYHKATLEEVWGKKYLDNSFNYRHYFYGPIYKFDKRERRWDIDHEGDAKRAVAFRPQSDAAAIQREDILALNEVDWFSGLMRLPTYDSIVVEAPVDKVDQAIELLIKQFAKPIPELGGLEIGFEVKVGLNLRDMSGVSI